MITYLIIVINHQKRRNIRDLTESREKRGFASPPHLFASSPTNRSNYQLQFFPLLYKCLAPSNAAPVRRHENGHQERKEEKKRLLPASSSYTHDVCPSSASLVQRLSRFRWTDLGTREALDASVVSPACITRRNRRKRMRRKTPTRRIKLQKAVNSNEPLDRAAARQQRFPHRFLFFLFFLTRRPLRVAVDAAAAAAQTD